jgi:glycosyltransferase involved in cell wall biosynthesis
MEIAFILSKDPLTSGGGIRTYVKYLSKNLSDFDDTILCGNRADFIFPFIFLKKGGYKCLIIHGNQYTAVKEKSIIMYRLFSIVEKYTMKRIDYIVYVGNESKRNYENRFKEHVDKVPFTIIPVGVDTNLFNIINKDRTYSETGLPKDKKIIMSVGRLNKEKRYDIAIESIYLLSQKRQDFRYYIIGDGPEKENIASLIQKYGLEETVFTLGSVEYEKIPVFLNCADVFLLTSDRENGPIVLKEAMATGCPVVSTEVGDAADIIKTNNGILVGCGEIKEIANALSSSLNLRWNRMEVRNSCEKYDWKVISKEFEKDVIKHFDS